LLFILAGAALLAAQPVPPMADGAWLRFFQDIVPAPIRLDQPMLPWLDKVLIGQAWPGAVNTLVLSQIALALSALLAAVAFPMIVPRVTGRLGAALGHGMLVLVRSTPEYMLAFVLLQVFGPSMLPAILALGLHNGAIIAHLMGRHASTLTLHRDAPRGLTLWGWELFPRLSGSFWALCLYRWEIIIRESAIMGILGITTLGFYVQRNVQELRLDRVALLLLVTIGITLAVDHLSRRLRHTMRLGNDLRIETSRGQWRT
jgi:phosphonate transport system permease protein